MSKENETTLLDSSLNTCLLSLKELNKPYYKNYNIKLIDMQDYKQIYIFPNVKIYREKIDNDKKLLFNDNLFNYNKKTRSSFSDNKPLFKNVIRSKIKLQRLVKCNANEFKTFITLTFNEDIKDLSIAYKRFIQFIKRTKKIYNDFKWVCVPEFQKSGRVHYHMITNIDLDNKDLVYTQIEEDKIYYHLMTWSKFIKNKKEVSNGFDAIELIKDKEGNDTKKICGYISKYMTKSYIEDCFYNKNRYYSSQNLIQPYDILIDLDNEKDKLKFETLMKDYEIIYSNDYLDNYDNTINFIELKKK